MNKRMLAALVALAGMFVALYLTMYKLGYIGTLTCAIGSCETVQTSKWATLLGFPVGAWGVGFYVTVLAVALAGLTPGLANSIAISKVLLVMTGSGVLFSAWLTYLELFVINAICQWCVISALLTCALLVISWLDYREVLDTLIESAAEQLRGSGYGADLRTTSETSLRAVRKE